MDQERIIRISHTKYYVRIVTPTYTSYWKFNTNKRQYEDVETITPNKRIKLEEKKITFEQQNILEIKNELNRTSSFNQEMEDNAGTILQQ